MKSKVGQSCLNVTDLEHSTKFYEALGLKVLHRIEIPDAKEVILGSDDSPMMLQLAQQKNQKGPIVHGGALWKSYIYTDDCQAAYDAALAFGCESKMVPTALPEWNSIAAFVLDPDGYSIEIVQATA